MRLSSRSGRTESDLDTSDVATRSSGPGTSSVGTLLARGETHPLLMTIGLRCFSCSRTYDIGTRDWRCSCGGLFNLEGTAPFAPVRRGSYQPWSMWRYRRSLPTIGSGERWEHISLGEGSTPIVQDSPGVLLKLDFLMPTLSFKDRGSVVLVAAASELGIRQVVADSSGNAGVSIAAYGARAGISTEVFVPSSTSPSKIAQLEAFGAVVRHVTGSRAEAALAAMSRLEETGAFYASHVYNPFFHHGTKTFAYECYEQLAGRMPEAVVVPAGNGTLLLGAALGFAELVETGLLDRPPRLFAVQASNCSPLAKARGLNVSGFAETAAEGIAIQTPPRLEEMMTAIDSTNGGLLLVEEDSILRARTVLRSQGLDVEPTAAAGYAALDVLDRQELDSVLVALTGAGVKDLRAG